MKPEASASSNFAFCLLLLLDLLENEFLSFFAEPFRPGGAGADQDAPMVDLRVVYERLRTGKYATAEQVRDATEDMVNSFRTHLIQESCADVLLDHFESNWARLPQRIKTPFRPRRKKAR